jgi:hypothetical protein
MVIVVLAAKASLHIYIQARRMHS